MAITATSIYHSLSTRIRIVSFSQSFHRIQPIDYSLLILDCTHHLQHTTHKRLIHFYQRVKVSYDLQSETSGLSSTKLGRRHSMRRMCEAHGRRLVYTHLTQKG